MEGKRLKIVRYGPQNVFCKELLFRHKEFYASLLYIVFILQNFSQICATVMQVDVSSVVKKVVNC